MFKLKHFQALALKNNKEIFTVVALKNILCRVEQTDTQIHTHTHTLYFISPYIS